MNVKRSLMKVLCEAMQTDDCVGHCNHSYCGKVENTADHLIENGVTVQKQSEWTEFVDDDPYVGELRYPMCKRCNHMALVASRYCPDCGALMRRGGAE